MPPTISLTLKGNGILVETIQRLFSESNFHLQPADKDSNPLLSYFSRCLADNFKMLKFLKGQNSWKKTGSGGKSSDQGSMGVGEQGTLQTTF